MAEAIRMPLLSDTMKEGIIAAWHKKVGDTIKADDVLADVETDKATMEVNPYVDGTLLYIGLQAGQAAKVNDIIAIVGKAGEDFSALLAAPAPAPTAAPAAPVAAPAAAAVAPAAATQAIIPGAAEVIRMPLLSDTMKEGKIVAWHKKVGDTVKADDVLAEVETDKATMEINPYVDGTLLYIGVKEGEAAQVNGIIAIVGKAGTDVTPYLQADATAPVAAQAVAPASAPASTTVASAPAAEHSVNSDERLKASPLAKKLAEDKGIDIHQVKGSGDMGRIIKRDVDNFVPTVAPVAATAAAKASAPMIASVPLGQEGHTDFPLSQMRRIIAERLTQSKNGAPHFYLRMSITMDNAIDARKRINEVSPVKVSFNDLIIKACAMSLRKHPEVNSSWMGDFIRQNNHIHVGTAVAVPDGLIVPVIKFADQKSLSQIAQEASTLIDKARNKKLQPPEFTGNTFSISNLGMMDIDEFTAIINPPDACILAVGKIAPTAVVEDGKVVVRQILKLTLSCDHRVVDGAVGASFMQTLKAHLENPVTMLV